MCAAAGCAVAAAAVAAAVTLYVSTHKYLNRGNKVSPEKILKCHVNSCLALCGFWIFDWGKLVSYDQRPNLANAPTHSLQTDHCNFRRYGPVWFCTEK